MSSPWVICSADVTPAVRRMLLLSAVVVVLGINLFVYGALRIRETAAQNSFGDEKRALCAQANEKAARTAFPFLAPSGSTASNRTSIVVNNVPAEYASAALVTAADGFAIQTRYTEAVVRNTSSEQIITIAIPNFVDGANVPTGNFTRRGLLPHKIIQTNLYCTDPPVGSLMCSTAALDCASRFHGRYEGGTLCSKGEYCGRCTYSVYLHTYCLVVEPLMIGSQGAHVWRESTTLQSCRYPFHAHNQTYVAAPASPTSLRVRVMTADDPLLVLEAITHGSRYFAPRREETDGVLCRTFGAVCIAVAGCACTALVARLLFVGWRRRQAEVSTAGTRNVSLWKGGEESTRDTQGGRGGGGASHLSISDSALGVPGGHNNNVSMFSVGDGNSATPGAGVLVLNIPQWEGDSIRPFRSGSQQGHSVRSSAHNNNLSYSGNTIILQVSGAALHSHQQQQSSRGSLGAVREFAAARSDATTVRSNSNVRSTTRAEDENNDACCVRAPLATANVSSCAMVGLWLDDVQRCRQSCQDVVSVERSPSPTCIDPHVRVAQAVTSLPTLSVDGHDDETLEDCVSTRGGEDDMTRPDESPTREALCQFVKEAVLPLRRCALEQHEGWSVKNPLAIRTMLPQVRD